MGLVQHEGGPCGVLAAIQAFVLKHLLFSSEDSTSTSSLRRSNNESLASEIFPSLSEESKSRALVRSMREILFRCGNNERAVIATFDVLDNDECMNSLEDEGIADRLKGLSVESGSDLRRHLRFQAFVSRSTALKQLEDMLPIFRSRMGVLLFLISALLSRGLDNVQKDRDEPDQPLVSAEFGHASQEIVNLLLSGEAVANVFDGNKDLEGGMFMKGISTTVEVGFLTLHESLKICEVGQHLKRPKWPIWVVGSESHYTVLFALDTKVQEENELEGRETQIRRAFDAQDQRGGGGGYISVEGFHQVLKKVESNLLSDKKETDFIVWSEFYQAVRQAFVAQDLSFISVEGFHQVLKEFNIDLPLDKMQNLTCTGSVKWSEFLQVILDLDNSRGGLKDSTGLMGKKVFNLYHFNGFAKSIPDSESPTKRPRLTKLWVSVPPEMAGPSEASTDESSGLVKCVRTRWAWADCNWDGDAPSIV